jgi:hypothetical protein
VTVQVIDSDIDDIDEAKGEPDVTVNGKNIRMTQAVDGNWYGYFANKDMAIEADKNPDDDLEFGIVCTNTEDITAAENFININLSDTNGVTFGAITCDGTGADSTLQNVLKDVKDLNPGGGPVDPGQIGVEPTAWAFSQLYSFSDERPVVVQYAKGGGAQTTTLTFSTFEPPSVNDDSGGGDNQWDTRPTFGISHEDRQNQVVENGFRFNSNEFMLTDNHHTDFAEQSVDIGTVNSFSATVYADKKLKIQEFLFGIPNVGEAHLAELGVEVWYDRDGNIDDVIVAQKSDVIDADIVSVSHEKTKCLSTDAEAKCDTTTVSMTFLEPLADKVMAIKAIDYALRDQRTFLNDGFDISGESLNPMLAKMIPSNERNQGLLKVTQVAKYSPYWTADDGRMFEMNSFGSFKQINKSFERFQDTGNAFTRQHSAFGGILDYEQNRATELFDSSELISELPESFAYIYPQTGERLTDEMVQEMQLQAEIAQRILDEMDKQNRHY